MKGILGEESEVTFKCIGSAAEDTRCFQPDEFDYLIIFKIPESVLMHKPYGKDFIFQATPRGIESLKGVKLDKLESGYYLVSDQVKDGVYRDIEAVLRRQMTSIWLEPVSKPENQSVLVTSKTLFSI